MRDLISGMSGCRMALVVTLLGVGVSTAGAQQLAEPTRTDLAQAYRRFERAYVAKPLETAERTRLNRAFDRATMAFFMGAHGKVLRSLNELTADLSADAEHRSAWLAVASLGVKTHPPISVVGDAPVQLEISSLFPVEVTGEGGLSLSLQVLDSEGREVVQRRLHLAEGKQSRLDLELPLGSSDEALAVGSYRLVVSGPEGVSLELGRHFVLEQPIQELRRNLEQQLEKLDGQGGEQAQALASCLARCGLLVSEASGKLSTEVLADPVSLVASLRQEVVALLRGENPYRKRSGDLWRTLQVGTRVIPMRVYVPEEVAASDEPRPLVVALHGMGGDENMFFEGYGAGRIKDLADRHGLVVVTPRTETFAQPGGLELLVETLAREQAIDVNRVYVLGHSMGAGATAGLLARNPELIAAACCVAGGGRTPEADQGPELLVVAGELDPLAPPARLKAGAQGDRAEFRVLEGRGHTLVMADVLPEAIEWLLARQRPSAHEEEETKPSKRPVW